MKTIFFITLTIIFASCVSKTGNSTHNDAAKGETISGMFDSKKGVMAPISCYCYNAGYLTTDDGQRVAVCFTDENIEVVCDKKITVTGKYATRKNEASPNNPCPAGEMQIFEATSYTCEK